MGKRQDWHADSSKSHKDAIPVKTRECLFPASICQRWSRKEDRDADHFSENVSLQAQIQLDWEAKLFEEAKKEQTGSFWPVFPSLPPAFSVFPHCLVSSESQSQSLRTVVTQEEPEIWGKRGYSKRPWLLHCEAWLIITLASLLMKRDEDSSYRQEETRKHTYTKHREHLSNARSCYLEHIGLGSSIREDQLRPGLVKRESLGWQCVTVTASFILIVK